MKSCSKCKKEKEAVEFYKDKRNSDGLYSACKSCYRVYKKRVLSPEEYEIFKVKHRAYVKAWSKTHSRRYKDKKYSSKYIKEYFLRSPLHMEKRKVRLKLTKEIRAGRVIRRPCEKCGEPKSHGHHEDYSKPLDVVWLCPLHHKERHAEINKLLTHPHA